MSDELILYTNPMSRGRIARRMLEEIGAPYKTEILEYGTSMKSPEYLKINPMGKVPTIKHGNKIVTECAAICAYLADAFPEAELAPPPDQRAEYYRWLFFTAGPFEYALTARAFKWSLEKDQEPMSGYGNLDYVQDTLEKAVSANKFIAGDRFTAADVYICSHMQWSMGFGTLDKRPAYEEYVARVGDRDAWKRADEIDEKLMAAAKGE